MTLKEIDARRRTLPVYQRAIAVERRLTAAIALGTVHAARLTVLRAKVRYAIRQFNAREVGGLLALWGPAFEAEILAAIRAGKECSSAFEEHEARPAHYTLGVAA